MAAKGSAPQGCRAEMDLARVIDLFSTEKGQKAMGTVWHVQLKSGETVVHFSFLG